MKALIAATILTAMSFPQETPASQVTPEQALVNQIAEAADLTADELQRAATFSWIENLRDMHGIVLPGGQGLPAPVMYFDPAEVYPNGIKPYVEAIYFFVHEDWTFYIRLGTPKGIQWGQWSVGEKTGDGGQYIHLHAFDFWADFQWYTERPLEPMRAPYFCNQGRRGFVTLTPGC